MFRHVPNMLTASRLVLAVVFFVLLSYYQYEGRGEPILLSSAFIVYILALLTDFLDGYLARLWKVEGAFGRMVDPYVDKVLVLGSFVFLAGKNFIIPDQTVQAGMPWLHIHPDTVFKTISGVTPAMVVILLARELLVTTLRSVSEGGGQSFGAALSGKLKMVLQSITILVILVYVNFHGWLRQSGYEGAATWIRDLCIWITIVVTVISGLTYVRRAVRLYQGRVLAGKE